MSTYFDKLIYLFIKLKKDYPRFQEFKLLYPLLPRL